MTATPREIVLDLPVPRSINRTKRPNWAATRRTAEWARTADHCRRLQLGPQWDVKPVDRFELLVIVDESYRGDIDNILKLLIDWLRTNAGLVTDDAAKNMREITIKRGFVPQGCRVTVKPIGSAS